MSIGPHLLGRTLEHDPRSRNYEHPIGAVPLKNVTHVLNMPHLDQANLGSCEGNTAAEFLGTAKAIRNRQAYNKANKRMTSEFLREKDAVKLYGKATTLDNDEIDGEYPPTDTGTSGNGIAKAMRAMGGLVTYNWTFAWDKFLYALQFQPIMLGLNWYESMFEYDAAGFVIPPKTSADPDGGHAVLAYAYRTVTGGRLGYGSIGCTNHWVNDDGSPWGVKIGGHEGSFWFRDNFLQELLIHQQGDSLVPVLM